MGSTSQNLTFQPQSPLSSSSNNNNGFPMLAIALLGISATAFLLVSYYIFVTKCCFRFQQLDPFRRFSLRQAIRFNNSHRAETLTPYSPSWQSRGLDELLIRELPTFQYSKNREAAEAGKVMSRCVVCLTEFQDYDVLRLLPKCSHAFHLDCIDVWLQNNNNCPLCRSTISGRNRYSEDRMIAPNSSPQDPYEMFLGGNGDEDIVAIELSRGEGSSRISMNPRSHSSRKFDFRFGKLCSKLRKHSRRVSIVGDEGIGMRGDDDDDRFLVHQPIRRSFSMDSVVDRSRIYTSVRENLRHNIDLICDRSVDNEESGISISRRMMSLFGQGGRGSRNVVCPVEL